MCLSKVLEPSVWKDLVEQIYENVEMELIKKVLGSGFSECVVHGSTGIASSYEQSNIRCTEVQGYSFSQLIPLAYNICILAY